MFDQLLVGSLITFASLLLASTLWWVLTSFTERWEAWLRAPPHFLKSTYMVGMVVLWSMMMMTIGVWLWAVVLRQMAAFGTFEEAMYFALVAYTTLGISDVPVPKEWRLLGGMVGANGFLMFGLMTAMLTDTLRHVRNAQFGNKV